MRMFHALFPVQVQIVPSALQNAQVRLSLRTKEVLSCDDGWLDGIV